MDPPLIAKEGSPPPAPPAAEIDAGDGAELRDEPAVRCAACGHALAQERDRIPLQTSTFVNPAAAVHTIAAFREANGCATAGEPTTYWTWFPGHAWRYALCGACGTHVGWAFDGPSSFFGLLVDRIA